LKQLDFFVSRFCKKISHDTQNQNVLFFFLKQQQQKIIMTENIFPSAVLFNSGKSTVCVELRHGVTLVGTLIKSDGWMNLVLQNVQRFSADGTQKWKCPEVVVRGNSIKTVRVSPGNVKPKPVFVAPSHDNNKQASGVRRDRGGNNNDGPEKPKMSQDERNKKYAKPKQ
jgi:small nuclear ribonucleoprotein (snRNP)-like protein